jgi:hypothetical protein
MLDAKSTLFAASKTLCAGHALSASYGDSEGGVFAAASSRPCRQDIRKITQLSGDRVRTRPTQKMLRRCKQAPASRASQFVFLKKCNESIEREQIDQLCPDFTFR